ncbi:MAG: hypothetical protein JWP75_1609 [Frondihabitans sp.]|nr:hypothetical protein [Frondihabitans sp.]
MSASREAGEPDVVTAETSALAAADAIIDDFGHHRREGYFAGFDTDATFIFHTHPRRLESRAEYEDLWRSWEDEHGFRVHSCTSSNRRIQILGHTAIFSHDVVTDATLDAERGASYERETIVLRYRSGAWRAIHEHLSPAEVVSTDASTPIASEDTNSV